MDTAIAGIMSIMNIYSILLMAAGVALGIIFGAIPGFTATMAVALCLPLTFGMDTLHSMCLLLGLYLGGISGGLISAILLNIPGTPSSIATCFDGHPMAARGEASKALSLGILSSVVGGFFSFAVLITISPYLARIAIGFTPFDFCAIALFSLTLMAGMSGNNLAKGMASGILGVFISFVGIDPIGGTPRFTMSIVSLEGGLALLPVLIGVFAVAEIIEAATSVGKRSDKAEIRYQVENIGMHLSDLKGQGFNLIRSAAIGTGIGILPGIGGGVSNLISYSVAQNQSKTPEKFGTGIPDGLVASEAANNACIGGAMIPLLTLGIPGDAITAVLVGGLMIHGISPGPLMFLTQGKLIYAIFAILIICNFIMPILMFGAMKSFIKLLTLPKSLILPTVMVLCIVGAFGANNRVFDIYVVFIFGIFGFLLNSYGFPTAPLVIGLILGPIFEVNMRRGLMFSQGSVTPFFTHPIALTFIILTIVSVILTVKRQKGRSSP